LERAGLPTAVLTAIPNIPIAVGANRVVKGIRVEHVCGDPQLSHDDDRKLQQHIVGAALNALKTTVDQPTLFEPEQITTGKETVNA
jgi:glycine/betaine/sarcosine/D-proline reductase family selenoprotein B